MGAAMTLSFFEIATKPREALISEMHIRQMNIRGNSPTPHLRKRLALALLNETMALTGTCEVDARYDKECRDRIERIGGGK